jgi:hypothetical protein
MSTANVCVLFSPGYVINVDGNRRNFKGGGPGGRTNERFALSQCLQFKIDAVAVAQEK